MYKSFNDWSQSIYSITVHKYGGNRTVADPSVQFQWIKAMFYSIVTIQIFGIVDSLRLDGQFT